MLENGKIIKLIREETGSNLKNIMSIIDKFHQKNYIPDKEDIIDIIKYQRIIELYNKINLNTIKTLDEYIDEIIKFKKETKNGK